MGQSTSRQNRDQFLKDKRRPDTGENPGTCKSATEPPSQPQTGDQVSLWSVMSNAGDGFLRVIGDSPSDDGTEYPVDMQGKLDDPSTIFTWQTSWNCKSKRQQGRENQEVSSLPEHVKDIIPWINLEPALYVIDSAEMFINGSLFNPNLPRGSDKYFYITVKGDGRVVAKEKDESASSGDGTESSLFNPERWPTDHRTPAPGKHVRFHIDGRDDDEYLGCGGDGTAKCTKQRGGDGADWYWPNPAVLFYIYNRGQPTPQ